MGAGRAASGAFGRGLGAAPPPESEAVRLARSRQEIMKGADMSTRKGSFEAANLFRDAGDMAMYTNTIKHGLGIKEPDPKEFDITELADGFKYYTDPTGKVAPRRVEPSIEAPVGDVEGERMGLFLTNADGSTTMVDQSFVKEGEEPPYEVKSGKLHWGILGTETPKRAKGTDPLSTKNESDFFWRAKNKYLEQAKPIRGMMGTLEGVENLLAQERSGAVDKAITAGIMSGFSSKARAFAEIEQWKNLGDLGERISGTLTRIVKGNRTEAQYSDLSALISEYKTKVADDSNKMKAEMWDAAKYGGAVPFQVIGEERYTTKVIDGVTWRSDNFLKTLKKVK